MSQLLVDTDVLIDYLRGEPDAISYLEGSKMPLLVSAITVAELFAGVRDGKERGELDVFLTAFEVIEINADIATMGGLFRRDFRKSHDTGLADALIAATAKHVGAQLVSLNRKHFPMVNVLVPYVK
jgi:predicted nucleic acid-binding protein